MSQMDKPDKPGKDAHAHAHQHEHDNHLDETSARVKALETLLVEKGLVNTAAIDRIIDTYQTKVGPRNGAKVVARAWRDEAFADWLKRDATSAIASLGFTGRQGEHMRVVFNTPQTHNVVVCTLCSCYPWSVLGLPPTWYKSPAYRSRVVVEPRAVLSEFGVSLPETMQVRVWDSTAELRYLVVPEPPSDHAELDDVQLAERVTRNSMIGLRETGMNGPHDLGGRAAFGAINPEHDEPVFHQNWESRVLGMTLACGSLGYWTLDESRHARESLPPGLYLSSSYYRIWFEALLRLLQSHGEVLPDELSDGRCRQAGRAASRQLVPERVDAVLSSGAPTSRALETVPRFAAGDSVRTIKTHVPGHCRLPTYARDKLGHVEAVHEPHVFPDASARGQRDEAQWLYSIVFDGEELWGEGGEPGMSVSLEAWESYLEPA